MGASVENQHLLAGLLEQTHDSGACDILKQKVVEIKPARGTGELPVVTLEDGSQIMPKLIVGSDGERSMTRQQYGIETENRSYGQKGLVCTVESLQPNEIAF